MTDEAQCRAEPTCEHYFTGTDRPHVDRNDYGEVTNASQLTDFCKRKCDQSWAETKACESQCKGTTGLSFGGNYEGEFGEVLTGAAEVSSLMELTSDGDEPVPNTLWSHVANKRSITWNGIGVLQGIMDGMGYSANDVPEIAMGAPKYAEWKDGQWNATFYPTEDWIDKFLHNRSISTGKVKYTCAAAACTGDVDRRCRDFCDTYSEIRSQVDAKRDDLPRLRREREARRREEEAKRKAAAEAARKAAEEAAAAQAKADAARKVREQAMQAKIAAGTPDQKKYCESVCAIFKTE